MNIAIASTAEQSVAPASEPIFSTSVSIECYALACVKGPNGSRHHIVVDPTLETLEAVAAWKKSGANRVISVKDRTGVFTRDVPCRVIEIIRSSGTLIITTDR